MNGVLDAKDIHRVKPLKALGHFEAEEHSKIFHAVLLCLLKIPTRQNCSSFTTFYFLHRVQYPKQCTEIGCTCNRSWSILEVQAKVFFPTRSTREGSLDLCQLAACSSSSSSSSSSSILPSFCTLPLSQACRLSGTRQARTLCQIECRLGITQAPILQAFLVF